VRTAILLLLLMTAGLGGLGLLPRQGHPVLLALPPGASAAGAFAAPGWRVTRMDTAGPFTLLRAAPEAASADPTALARAAGAFLVLAADLRAACQPPSRGA
jgi:hypothetical protein